jgi:signal transduction histidine kinase
MAASMETQTSENVTTLKKTIADLDRSAKTLMKRDEELSRANDRLLRLDHAKSEFVSIAAHQLRTPLSALKWAQQMLIEGEAGPITEPQKALLMQSQESVRRMVTLVNDLLAADHLEYGKVAYMMKPASVEETLELTVKEIQPLATEHHVTLDIDIGAKRTTSHIDQERIKEAFLNILNNAIKYTPEGGTVTIRANYGMGRILLTIADTGIGIPMADRDRLFEKFVRMENAKKVDANGSGLGLFIVKKVIDAHGGKIWFDSVEGQGTTFYIELPVVNN